MGTWWRMAGGSLADLNYWQCASASNRLMTAPHAHVIRHPDAMVLGALRVAAAVREIVGKSCAAASALIIAPGRRPRCQRLRRPQARTSSVSVAPAGSKRHTAGSKG